MLILLAQILAQSRITGNFEKYFVYRFDELSPTIIESPLFQIEAILRTIGEMVQYQGSQKPHTEMITYGKISGIY